MAPIELFAGITLPSYDLLLHADIFGCPVFVLDPRLQAGKRLLKWTPRSRRCQFLSYSLRHSTFVGQHVAWICL